MTCTALAQEHSGTLSFHAMFFFFPPPSSLSLSHSLSVLFALALSLSLSLRSPILPVIFIVCGIVGAVVNLTVQ